jgi:hypothetical protein
MSGGNTLASDSADSGSRKDFRELELSASVPLRPCSAKPQLLVQRHRPGVALVGVQTDGTAPFGHCPCNGKHHELPPNPMPPRCMAPKTSSISASNAEVHAE